MRTGIVAAVAAAVLAVSPAADAKPHHNADKRPCWSKSEVEHVRAGWTRTRVERWTETTDLGQRMQTPELTYYGYFYPSCTPGRRVIVYYRVQDDDSLVVAKYA